MTWTRTRVDRHTEILRRLGRHTEILGDMGQPLLEGPMALLADRLRAMRDQTAQGALEELRQCADRMSDAMVKVCEALRDGVAPKQRDKATLGLQDIIKEVEAMEAILARPIREDASTRPVKAKDLPS